MPPYNPSELITMMRQRPIAVAEIGTSHGGNLNKGLELIDAAAGAGADAVKVQVVFAREILPPQAGLVPLPGGLTPLYQVFESLERSESFYAALARRAEENNLVFFGTPFGPESMSVLQNLGVSVWKVASPELNHEPLLEMLATTGLPIILSTGVSLEKDIERALHVLADSADRSGLPPPPTVLLHCITSYPAPEAEANLLAIPKLKHRFKVPTGLSDHSIHPDLLPSLAVALGAVMVEKHLCLSHSGKGLDDPVALLPHEFSQMTKAMHRYTPENNTYCVKKKPYFHAIENKEHFDWTREKLIKKYGEFRVKSALGNGKLDLAPSEKDKYGRTNRSIHAVRALSAGTVLSETNTAILRTEKILRPGIPPMDRKRVYGKILLRDVAAGDGIVWDDIPG